MFPDYNLLILLFIDPLFINLNPLKTKMTTSILQNGEKQVSK